MSRKTLEATDQNQNREHRSAVGRFFHGLFSLVLAAAAMLPLIGLASLARAALGLQRGLLISWFNRVIAVPFLLIGPLAIIILLIIARLIFKPLRKRPFEMIEAALIAVALAWSGSVVFEPASPAATGAWVAICTAAVYLNSREMNRWAPKRIPNTLRWLLYLLTPLWSLYMPRPIWTAIGARTGETGRKAGQALGAIFAVMLVPGLVLPTVIVLAGQLRPQPGVQRIVSGSFYDVELDTANGMLYTASPADDLLIKLDLENPGQRTQAEMPTSELQDLLLYEPTRELLHYCRMRGCPTERKAGYDLLAIDANDISSYRWRKGSNTICRGSTYLALDAERDLLIVSCEDTGAIVWDLAREEEVADIGFNSQTSHMTVWPGKAIYLSWGKAERVLKITYDNWMIEGSLETGTYPNRLLVVPQRNELLVSLPLEGQVLVLDPDTLAVRRRIETVLGARAMAYDPVSGDLFVASILNWQVSQIDLDTGHEKRRLRVGRWLRQITLDTQKRTAYVTSRYDGLLSFEY